MRSWLKARLLIGRGGSERLEGKLEEENDPGNQKQQLYRNRDKLFILCRQKMVKVTAKSRNVWLKKDNYLSCLRNSLEVPFSKWVGKLTWHKQNLLMKFANDQHSTWVEDHKDKKQ